MAERDVKLDIKLVIIASRSLMGVAMGLWDGVVVGVEGEIGVKLKAQRINDTVYGRWSPSLSFHCL